MTRPEFPAWFWFNAHLPVPLTTGISIVPVRLFIKGCVRIAKMTTAKQLPIELVLASGSPRRKMLLSLLGVPFDIQIADVDESPLNAENPEDYVVRLALQKAQAVAEKLTAERIIIAADTAVVDHGQILGKPADLIAAEAMLRRLRGGTHRVLTGLALLHTTDGAIYTTLAETEVPMREYSLTEMQAYLDTGDSLDKAGGYAIQHAGFNPVEKLSGCYANVVGLPLCAVILALRTWGFSLPSDAPQSCQRLLDYECDAVPKILQLPVKEVHA